MNPRLTRRQMLAATALVACNKPTSTATTVAELPTASSPEALASVASPPPGRPHPGEPPPGPHVGETKLFLPTTAGVGPRFPFPKSPGWELDAPGWFLPSTMSAGSAMLIWPSPPRHQLWTRLRSFRQLPDLLTHAQSLGTNVVYLVDWYNGADGMPRAEWWRNKGDYVPASDLGGEAALREGLAAVHARGGRVIVYVEGFLLGKATNIGKQRGREWSIMTPGGPLVNPYPRGWKPCPAVEGWVAYMESVARRLAGYGLDGIFVDSYGFQKDHPCFARAHGHAIGDKEVFNRGAAQLLRRFAAAFRAAQPEGIVFIEGPTIEGLFESVDGSFDWGVHSLVGRFLWDAQGRTDTITSGWSLDDWNQIVAIGAKLGCHPQVLEAPPEASAIAHYDLWAKRDAPDIEAKLNNNRNIYAGVHHWRNIGLAMGLPMPGLDDLTPRTWEAGGRPGEDSPDSHDEPPKVADALPKLRARAATIDAALAGKSAPTLAAYVKSLMDGRASVAKVIDYGSTVARVDSGSPHVAAWRFTSPAGTALTCVNVGEEARSVSFPGTNGNWKDGVTGEAFAARGGALTVHVAPHRVRLLREEG